jgi:hypothetical protein
MLFGGLSEGHGALSVDLIDPTEKCVYALPHLFFHLGLSYQKNALINCSTKTAIAKITIAG